jgi:hypothetical protein
VTAHPCTRVLAIITDDTHLTVVTCTHPGCRRAAVVLGDPDDTYVSHELATLYGWTPTDARWTCPGHAPNGNGNGNGNGGS